MKRIALYLGIAAAMVASCSIQEVDIKVSEQEDVIFYASFEQPSEGTRVYANEDLLLRWTADDRVSIFNKNTYNQQYRFTGETGDNAGGFRKVDTEEFVTGNAMANVVSVYPYQEGTKITEDGILTLTLPAEQHYAENTFGLGANTMVSVSEDNFLQYKNVGGYLRLSLYGEGVSVSAITLRGNFREKLAGKATVTMPLDGTPTAVLANDATDEITLVCDTPVALGATAEGCVDFWFVVPPVTFSKGFTVSVSQATGGLFEKSTSKSITIGRSNLSKMSPMEVERRLPVPEAVDLGLPSGLKWASFNVGASKPEEYGYHYAWGETDPNADYFWSNYRLCMGSYTRMTKYCFDSSFGYNGFIDNKTVLDLCDDAANVNLGSIWRMPTNAEIAELLDNCSWEWTSMNGINGQKVTGPNGNSIFLPAAGNYFSTDHHNVASLGEYWSSSLSTDNLRYAWYLFFTSSGLSRVAGARYCGSSVRPVYGEFVFVESVSLNKTSLSLLEGSTEQLTFSISPGNATEKTVTWISGDTSVATVSSEGEVTAVSTGTATITAWASDGEHYATCEVTVREPASGPEAIDLGLPSGLKWASYNLGATKPEEYGDYYAWGETEPYYSSQDPLTWKDGKERGYAWSSYKWCMGSYLTMTKYCSSSSYGYEGFTDSKSVLDLEDDVAYMTLDAEWRMPTYDEWNELLTCCTWEWTSMNGVNGRRVTGSNGNSIFLPTAGCRYDFTVGIAGINGNYWSSSLNTDYPYYAWSLYFDSGDFRLSGYNRFDGRSIRPVCD